MWHELDTFSATVTETPLLLVRATAETSPLTRPGVRQRWIRRIRDGLGLQRR